MRWETGTQSISSRGKSKAKAWVNMKYWAKILVEDPYLDFLGNFLDLKEGVQFQKTLLTFQHLLSFWLSPGQLEC